MPYIFNLHKLVWGPYAQLSPMQTAAKRAHTLRRHWFGDRSYYNTNMNKGRYLIKKKSTNWKKNSFTKLTFINIY